MHIIVTGENAVCEIGNNVTVNAYSLSLTKINVGKNSVVIIGDNSLFSNGIGVYTTDFHKIYDSDGKLINPNKNIIIGIHCWIGLETIILKGSKIPDNCVIGAGALVNYCLDEESSIYVGRPVRKVKENINWEK